VGVRENEGVEAGENEGDGAGSGLDQGCGEGSRDTMLGELVLVLFSSSSSSEFQLG
jgi:hypothetical protein